MLLTASYFCTSYVFYLFFNWLFIYLVDQRGFKVLEGGFYAAAPWISGVKAAMGSLSRTRPGRWAAAGVDAVCGINYVGNGFADVMFTLYEGQRGGYRQYNRAARAALPPRPAGPVNSVVTGTCDPVELAQLQRDYDQG